MEKETKNKSVNGFSKLSKRGKLLWIVNNFFKDPEQVMKELIGYWHQNEDQQKIIDNLSENTITNFVLPYSVAPNFLINGKEYAVPMVIEESSVVAAASKAAKYWSTRGGFHTEIISNIKEGNIYFTWDGSYEEIQSDLVKIEKSIRDEASHLTANMEQRGGGILTVNLVDLRHTEANYMRLDIDFDTCDSMGANFINSILECGANVLRTWVSSFCQKTGFTRNIDIIMSILTNYTPKCLVKAYVECPVSSLTGIEDMAPEVFAYRFEKAVHIARVDTKRATTHNKGIFNGIDAVVLATGNDFRAIEACGHAYAARNGHYSSLSECLVSEGQFKFSMTIPLAVGTVGGLTSLHPMAKRSLELLGNPTAQELMSIIACTGLAQNFGAVKSLVTTGIQKGHMKMHIQNMLWQLNATEQESLQVIEHFSHKTISFADVRAFIETLRSGTIYNTQS